MRVAPARRNRVYYERICSCYRPRSLCQCVCVYVCQRLIIQSKHCTLYGATRVHSGSCVLFMYAKRGGGMIPPLTQIKQFDESININYYWNSAVRQRVVQTVRLFNFPTCAHHRTIYALRVCTATDGRANTCAIRVAASADCRSLLRGLPSMCVHIYTRSLVGPINLT